MASFHGEFEAVGVDMKQKRKPFPEWRSPDLSLGTA
jgi:hypothetical protein